MNNFIPYIELTLFIFSRLELFLIKCVLSVLIFFGKFLFYSYVCSVILKRKDMNKFSFFLLLMLLLSSQSINGNSVSDRVPIDIYVGFMKPHSTKDHIMRSPVKVPDVYLMDNLVTFDAFGSTCALEVADTETNETVYNQVIPAGGTSCLLPSTLKGRYLIRFVFESMVYWGYIEL